MNGLRYRSIFAFVGVPLLLAALAGLAVSPVLARNHGSAMSPPVKTSPSRILINSKGRTLYVFAIDSKNKSACYGKCAKFWPPLIVPSGTRPASSMSGVSGKFGVTMRKNGKHQLTFNGAPLYTFVGDHKPGDITGEGLFAVGGYWWAVAVGK